MVFGAGEMNRIVIIERKTETPDGSGGWTRTWSQVAKAWAKANPIGGKEALLAGTLQSRQPWRIQMYYRTDIQDTTNYRLRLDGKALNIASANDPDGRRSSLLIFAETEFD